MRFTNFLVIFLHLCLCRVNGEQRHLSYELNPDCNKNCNDSSIVHITSSNSNGTFHYLWSFVNKFTPVIFIFETDNKAKLNISWDDIVDQSKASLRFDDGKVYNSYAMEVSKLYFINTTDNNNNTIYTIPLEKINWEIKNSTSSSAILFTFESSKSSPLNGTLRLTLSVFNVAGRNDFIPRLQYTESSNLLDVTADNIHFKIEDNKTAQAQLVCDLTHVMEGEDILTNLHESVSIDDEYTPGVFQRYVYKLDAKREQSTGATTNKSAYAEWKPVAYFDTLKVIAKSIKVTSPTLQNDTLKRHTLLNAYFVGKHFRATALKDYIFGIPDDAFDYQKNRYLQFSLAYGLNQVPEETLSMTLKIIIIAGLGLPMVLFLISIIYTIVRKLRSNNDFTSLTEETD